MAVIDELVARLGFKVEGKDQLRQFDAGLKKAGDGVKKFGNDLNKSLFGGKMASGAVAFPKLADGLKNGTAAAGGLSTALGRIALLTAGVVGGAVLAAGAILKMGKAFTRAAGEAAKLRREMQNNAAASRTTARGVDATSKGFGAIGLHDRSTAEELTKSLHDKADEAIREGGDAAEKFKKWGVQFMDPKTHVQRDTNAVAQELIKNFLDRQEKARSAREKFDKSGQRDKKALKEADKLEKEQREFIKAWDFQSLVGALSFVKNWAEYQEKQQDANNRNPGPTGAQEERSRQIAENFHKLSEATSALSQMFDNLRDMIANAILPYLVKFADGIVAGLKKLGAISETNQEQKSRIDREAGIGATDKIKTALKLSEEKGSGSLVKALLGDQAEKAKANLARAADRYKSAVQSSEGGRGKFNEKDQKYWDDLVVKFRAELESAADAVRKLESAASDAGKAVEQGKSGIAEKAVEQGKSGIADNIKGAADATGVKAGAQSAGKAAGTSADNRKYEDFGNDQRTISITTNVNQTVSGVDGVARASGVAASQGATAAAKQIKSSNASTGALTAP